MISKLTTSDFQAILTVVNNAAIAYKGKIPSDRWKEPYMSAQELKEEIQSGVQFYGLIEQQCFGCRDGNSTRQRCYFNQACIRVDKLSAERIWRKTTQTSTRLSRNIQGLCGNMGSSNLGNKILSKKRVQTGFNRGKE